MNFGPKNSLESALPENITFSDDWEEFIEQWTNLYRKVATKINGKERGFYPLELEIINDQQFFIVGNSRKYRNVFRKVFNFNTIAPGASLNIPHDITNMSEFTKIYGTCITSVVDYRPIPYSSVTAANAGIELNVNSSNIIVINGATSPNIRSGIIVLEYVKS